jgi:NAD(P)-dependent dehydrogenase (short-subunit alcohol dehydrogenase family)
MVPTATKIVVKKTLERFGRIDALVNIAGAVAAGCVPDDRRTMEYVHGLYVG